MVKGDAFDAHAVAAAIAGQEVVISCLSSSAPMKNSTEVQRMTANIVQGMLSAGIDRIAYCASVADFLVKAIEQPERYSHSSVGLSL